ncbi:hypothetical protein CFP71_21275 [Amycolatopsis thailandensis]|uniref:Uncharacterized protein n=1 Tax=Amycolatopsis thailandensis TaxID=589330 RepID=A0A229S4C1_9PSEU|nr:hypothetical protein [Amycolatopsis thailandensis]OXM53746.1 hypothetical protein CFP71_21275 [Amycolatopsis thailandensis]
MGFIHEMPPEAGAWQVETRRESFYLHRGETGDLSTSPTTGFSCPEESLPGLVAALKLVMSTKAYQEDARRPVGPCAITLESGRANVHVPVITYGAHLEIRYGEVPILLGRLESLLNGTYGEVVRGL